MKKALMLCLTVLLALSVCACSGAGDSAYTVTVDGTNYVIDPENSTVFDGRYTYQYQFSRSASDYSIDITYPDGSTYWWEWQTNGGFGGGGGGGSDDYDENRYASGDMLCNILMAGSPAPRKSNSGMILIAVIVLGIGLFNAISPHTAWYLSSGWKYKNAEPSDAALGFARLGGIAAIIFAFFLMFAS